MIVLIGSFTFVIELEIFFMNSGRESAEDSSEIFRLGRSRGNVENQ